MSSQAVNYSQSGKSKFSKIRFAIFVGFTVGLLFVVFLFNCNLHEAILGESSSGNKQNQSELSNICVHEDKGKLSLRWSEITLSFNIFWKALQFWKTSKRSTITQQISLSSTNNECVGDSQPYLTLNSETITTSYSNEPMELSTCSMLTMITDPQWHRPL